jgi:CheY-like chemotaxis protein
MRYRDYKLKWLPLVAACSLLLALGAIAVAPLSAEEAADEAPAEEMPAEDASADELMAEEPAAEEPALDELPADEVPKPSQKPKPGSDEEESTEAALPEDPAVQAVLESHPQTPADLLRAIDILVDLNQAALAKPFVEQLSKEQLDLAAKAALAAQFNSAKLLKLARNEELSPALGTLVDDILKSAEAFRRDPQRLAEWATHLNDPNETVQAQAVLALLRAREAAVAPLVAILADAKRTGEHAMAKRVLVQLGDLAIQPLLGALESPDSQLKTQVIEVLGSLRAADAAAALLAPSISPAGTPELRQAAARALQSIGQRAPTAPEAMKLLEQAARRALERSRDASLESAAGAEVWHWNAKRGQSMPIQYDTTGAALATAARLSRDLYRLDPNDPTRRRLYLTTLLQAAKFRNGLDKPLPTGAGTAHAVAAHFGPHIVQDVLIDAMANGYVPAATAAAEILGDIGSATLLADAGAKASPLALAAQSSDRRLRFAAIRSILKYKPSEPFAGSSHVADGLGFFAGSYGVPRILVVHPRSDEGQKIAGLAAELGFDADLATNGRQAFELATRSPDYELIFIHSAIERPRVDELVAQLRRDRRTALLPIGLIAPLDDLDRLERFARSVPRAQAFLQPRKPEEMKIFTDEVLARGGRYRLSAAERKAQATAALDWLSALGEQSQSVFDIRRQEPAVVQVLYVPDLSARAATVLGQLGTATSQRSLLELADQTTQPLDARQAAAAAFRRSVGKYGILLTHGEVLEQYSLYNANEGRDANTNSVLGSILDTIENKGDSASNEP